VSPGQLKSEKKIFCDSRGNTPIWHHWSGCHEFACALSVSCAERIYRLVAGWQALVIFPFVRHHSLTFSFSHHVCTDASIKPKFQVAELDAGNSMVSFTKTQIIRSRGTIKIIKHSLRQSQHSYEQITLQ
jgi:hypothetical protein